MKHKTIAGKRMMGLTSIVLLLALVLAACQAAATATQVPTQPVVEVVPTNTAMPVASASEASLQVATDPKLGQILVDGKGMTLYMYTKDTADTSNCTGGCLAKWPPLLTQGKPTLGAGVDASLVGNAKLADGTMIVTYNHMPLYYWVNDKKAGDATGQGVGNVWYVVAPDGKPVGMEAPAAATPTTAPASASEATLNVATDPKLGQILVDGKGMTLYMYTKDTADTSNCTGGCLAKWPPLLTQGKPTLGAGVDASLVGNAKLADGTMIVTYNHMPLYYWVNDKKAGDATGQGVGNVWYVVAPDGKPVGMDSSSSGSTSGSAEVELQLEDVANLGKILVDGKGMTLYIFTNDQPDKSNCTGDCLVKWPPFLTQGTPKLGDGIDSSLVGTAKLADGSMIVTYNHMPLYYWYKDTKPGDALGQGVGSVWFVIGADGKPIGN